MGAMKTQYNLEVENLRNQMIKSQQDIKKFCQGSGKHCENKGKKALQNEY